MSTSFAAAKTVERFPASSELHLLADHIEILCLVSSDHSITQSEFIDRARERNDLGGELIDFQEEIEEITEEAEFDAEPGSPAAAIHDRWTQLGEDVFAHLHYRVGAFSGAYPFRVEQETISLTESLSDDQRVYLFLLLASALRHFGNADRTRLASVFEVASYEALKAYMPKGSEVYMFGKHGLNQGRYSGRLWYKLQRLISDLQEAPIAREGNFKPQNTGDGGLDLVAWTPVGDSTPGFLLVFGQCGCTLDWVEKQSETGPDRWDNYMTFTVRPLRLTFIPFCFRNPDGTWYDALQIHKTMLVDRLRMLHLLRGKADKLHTPTSKYVDHAVAYSQSVV